LIGRSPGGRAGGGEQHGQPGAADLQQGAVLEGDGGADPLPVDEGAVGGAEIGGDQGRIGLGAQLEVVARDPGGLEDDVGVAAAAPVAGAPLPRSGRDAVSNRPARTSSSRSSVTETPPTNM